MKKYVLLICISSIASIVCFAQESCPCCSEFNNQFDFWVGEWEVYDTTGNKLGENSISKLEDNCILNEHWIGGKGYSGRSYNYFNRTDSTWNQLWIDNTGSHLELKGNLVDGRMVLKSELLKGQQVDWYYNQITWTPLPDGTVEQLWEIYSNDNTLIMNAFKGIYHRK